MYKNNVIGYKGSSTSAEGLILYILCFPTKNWLKLAIQIIKNSFKTYLETE